MDFNNFLSDINAELDNALNNENKIHISVKQRNTRKMTTIIENMDTNPAIKKSNKTMQSLLTIMKKKFNCGGSCEIDETDKNVIILQGDKRQNIKEYLQKEFKLENANFIIHG